MTFNQTMQALCKAHRLVEPERFTAGPVTMAGDVVVWEYHDDHGDQWLYTASPRFGRNMIYTRTGRDGATINFHLDGTFEVAL